MNISVEKETKREMNVMKYETKWEETKNDVFSKMESSET